jgi:hypothetical protein
MLRSNLEGFHQQKLLRPVAAVENVNPASVNASPNASPPTPSEQPPVPYTGPAVTVPTSYTSSIYTLYRFRFQDKGSGRLQLCGWFVEWL